jgi:bifunctional non-homologous end joining protein LigD
MSSSEAAALACQVGGGVGTPRTNGSPDRSTGDRRSAQAASRHTARRHPRASRALETPVLHRIECTELTADTCRMAMRIKRLPVGFVIPAQPVLASKPPTGADWVHEIKHDGYRMIVRRDGPAVRLYSRNAYDWTARLSAIAAAAERIKAKSFTIDGEAVVLGPDGLSRFEELSRREAADTAILYAFDLIEHDGDDLRKFPFLDRKAALAGLLRNTKAGILFNEHIVEDGPIVFAHACRLGAEGIVSKKIDSAYQSGPCRIWIKVRNPASIAVQRERSEIWNRGGSARRR